MSNNFGIQVTIEAKDAYSKKLKEFEEALNKSKKQTKEFTEASKNSERQTEKTNNSIKRGAKEVDNLSRSLDKNVKQQSKFKQFMQSTGGRIATGVVGFLGISKIVSDLAHFDDSLRRIKSNRMHDYHNNMALANEATGKLSETLKKLSSQSGKSVGELSHVSEMLSKTWSIDEINNGLGAIVKTSVNLNANLDETAGAMQTIKSLFPKMGMEDIFQQTSFAIDGSRMSLTDYTEALKYAAPATAAYGQSADDMVLILRQLAEAGKFGGIAGTAYNTLVSRLANPAIASAFKDIGLSFKDINIGALDITQIFDNINKAITKTQKRKGGDIIVQSTLAKAFGTSAGSIKSLIDNVETIKISKFKTQKEFYSTNQAEKMYVERQKSLQTTLNKLKSSFSNLILSLEPLIGLIASIVEGMTSLLNFITPVVSKILGTASTAVKSVVNGISNVYNKISNNQNTSTQAMQVTNQASSYFSNILGRQSNQSQLNSLQPNLNMSTIPNLSKSSLQNNNTSINLVVEDKAGVNVSIKEVQKSDRGPVEIKQRSQIDNLNY